MNISTNRPNTLIDDFSFTKNVIIFSYCDWSVYATIAHTLLIQSLQAFPEIHLFILDIDKPETFSYMHERGILSHGWGETYWMKEETIIASVKRYDTTSIKTLMNNHQQLIYGNNMQSASL